MEKRNIGRHTAGGRHSEKPIQSDSLSHVIGVV